MFIYPVCNGITDARVQIRAIKAALRHWGVPVEDLPTDEPIDSAVSRPAPAPTIPHQRPPQLIVQPIPTQAARQSQPQLSQQAIIPIDSGNAGVIEVRESKGEQELNVVLGFLLFAGFVYGAYFNLTAPHPDAWQWIGGIVFAGMALVVISTLFGPSLWYRITAEQIEMFRGKKITSCVQWNDVTVVKLLPGNKQPSTTAARLLAVSIQTANLPTPLEISLTGSYRPVLDAVLERTTDRIVANIFNHFAHGMMVNFGAVKIDRQNLYWGKGSGLAWNDIAAVYMTGSELRIKDNRDQKVYPLAELKDVENYPALDAVIAQLSPNATRPKLW